MHFCVGGYRRRALAGYTRDMLEPRKDAYSSFPQRVCCRQMRSLGLSTRDRLVDTYTWKGGVCVAPLNTKIYTLRSSSSLCLRGRYISGKNSASNWQETFDTRSPNPRGTNRDVFWSITIFLFHQACWPLLSQRTGVGLKPPPDEKLHLGE